MIKKTFFIDFDNTLYNTDKALIKIFKDQGGKTIDDKSWEDITMWDYTDIIPGNQKVINELFKDKNKTLYHKDGFYDGMVDLIKSYYDKGHKIIVASIGNPENSISKINLIREIMPFAIQMPTIHDDVLSLTKCGYNMDNCIFLDDSVKILNQTNSTDKILIQFGKEKQKSIGYKGVRATSISELTNILINLTEY